MQLAVRGAGQLGDGDPPLGEQRDQGVLDLREAAGDLLDPGDRAGGHRAEHRRGHQRLAAGALGEQQGVVPAVLELVLGGARGALDGERAGAADGGGEEFGEHRLGGAGLADEQQAALAGEGDDAAFDEGPLADELLLDRQAPAPGLELLAAAAHHEGDDGARGEPPAGRAGAGVVRGEELQLGGELLLRRDDLPGRGVGAGGGGTGGGSGGHRRAFLRLPVRSSSKPGASPSVTRCQARANSSGTAKRGSTSW